MHTVDLSADFTDHITLKGNEAKKEIDINLTANDYNLLTVDQEFELKTVEDIVLKLKTILESKDFNLSEDEVVILLDRILKRLNGVEHFLATSDFKKSIDEIKADASNKRKLRTNVNTWVKNICPINIQSLLLLMNQTEEAALMLENQDVIMFLGASQSGKSSTIHYLVGSKIGIDQSGKVVVFKDSELADVTNVKTGTGRLVSVTKTINPVKVSKEALRKLGVDEVILSNSCEEDGIILCDAPGFGDTDGVEVDISNGIGIIRALQKCKSVKFIIVLTDQFGDTGDNFIKNIKTIGSMFCDVQSHLKSFSYVFTKCPNPQDIKEKIDAIHDRVAFDAEKQDTNFGLIIKNMHTSIVENEPRRIIFDESPASVLEMVLQSGKISDTYEAFQDFISQESHLALSEYMRIAELSVSNYLGAKEIDSMVNKMKDLSDINLKIKSDEGNKATDLLKVDIERYLDDKHRLYKSILRRIEDPTTKTESLNFQEDSKSLMRFFEEFVDLDKIVKFVDRSDLVPEYSTLLEKTVMEITNKYVMNIFTFEENEEIINSLNSVSINDKSDAACAIDKVYSIKSSFISNSRFIGTGVTVAIEYMTKSYYDSVLLLHSKLRPFVDVISPENISTTSSETMEKVGEYLRSLKSFLDIFGHHIEDKWHQLLLLAIEQWEMRVHQLQLNFSVLINNNELFELPNFAISSVVYEWKRFSDLPEDLLKVIFSNNYDLIIKELKEASDNHQMLLQKLIGDFVTCLPTTTERKEINFNKLLKLNELLTECNDNLPQDCMNAIKTVFQDNITFFDQNVKQLENDQITPLDEIQMQISTVNLLDFSKYFGNFDDILAETSWTKLKDLIYRIFINATSIIESNHLNSKAFRRISMIIIEMKKLRFLIDIKSTESAFVNVQIELVKLDEVYLQLIQIVLTLVQSSLTVECLLSLDNNTILNALEHIPYLPSDSVGTYADSFEEYLITNLSIGWTEIKRCFDENADELWLDSLRSSKMVIILNRLLNMYNFFISSSPSKELQFLSIIFEDIPQKHVKHAISDFIYPSIEELLSCIDNVTVLHAKKLLMAVNGIDRHIDSIIVNENVLSKFDIVNPSNLSFHRLSESLEIKLKKSANDLNSQISTTASTKHWQELSQLLIRANKELSKTEYTDTLKTVRGIISGLVDVHLNITKQFNPSSFTYVFDTALASLNDIKLAKTELLNFEFLDFKLVDDCERSLQTLIQNRVEYSFNDYLVNYDFKMLEEHFIALTEISTRLISSKVNMKFYESRLFPCYDLYMKSLLQGIRLKIDECFDSKVAQFDDINDISSFSRDSPLQFLESIKSCQALLDHGRKYAEFYDGFKKDLIEKYSQMLTDSEPLESLEKNYEDIWNSRNYFPSDFRPDIDKLCQKANDIISKGKQEMEIEKSSIKAGKILENIPMFQAHFSISNFKQLRELQKLTEDYLLAHIQIIEAHISKGQLIKVIAEFTILTKYLLVYQQTLQNLKTMSATPQVYTLHELKYKGRNNKNRTSFYIIRNQKEEKVNPSDNEIRTKKYVIDRKNANINFKSETLQKSLGFVDRIKGIFRSNLEALEHLYVSKLEMSLDIVVSFINNCTDNNYAIITENEVQLKKSFKSLYKTIADKIKKFEEILKRSDIVVNEFKEILLYSKENNRAWDIWDEFVNSTISKQFINEPYLNTQILRYDSLKRNIRSIFDGMVVSIKQTSYLHNVECTTKNETDRDRFYVKVSNSYNSLLKFDQLIELIDINISEFLDVRNSVRQHISDKISEFYNYLKIQTDQIPTENMNIYHICTKSFDNFRAIQDNFTDLEIIKKANDMKQTVESMFHSKFKNIGSQITNFPDILAICEADKIIDLLVQLKTLANLLPHFSASVNNLIDTKLMELRKGSQHGIRRFDMIMTRLNTKLQLDSSGEHIKSLLQHKDFMVINLIRRNMKTSTFTILNVLGLNEKLELCTNNGNSSIESKDMDLRKRKELHGHYLNFDKVYWDSVNKGLNENMKEPTMKECIDNAHRFISDNSLTINNRIIKAMAYIFSYWTLSLYSGRLVHFNDSESEKSDPEGNSTKKSSLRQPHPAQVIAIFRLLEIGESITMKSDTSFSWSFGVTGDTTFGKVEFNNHLVQIPTGEGKSVVLATTSTLLAMMGFNVDCACYSKYLSNRDFLEFKPLFDKFGVTKYISYGTFGQLCEQFINLRGDIRQIVESTITGTSRGPKEDKILCRKRILLIDEVDTFFSPDFFGKLYEPFASIADRTLTSLVLWLWDNRTKALPWKKVSESLEFNDCLKRFSYWKELIIDVVKGMVCDLKIFMKEIKKPNYKSEYIVVNDQIAYKEHDSYNPNIIHGYKTMFTYLQEYELKNISKENMMKALVARLYCGGFLFDKIPNQYNFIMGVTGTLKQFVDGPHGTLLNDYKISKFTYMPSVYGTNQLIFAENTPEDVAILTNAEFLRIVPNEIKNRLQSRKANAGDDYKRAVFVFFDSIENLKSFYDDPAFIELRDHVIILSEDVSTANKEGIIRAAASTDQIVLMTRAFGRGTDFICNDKKLIDAGGVHVIQTFLSKQVAEEVQIKGRTARQGDHGSYSLMLTYDELCKFGITSEIIDDIKNSGKRYSSLNDIRNKYYSETYLRSNVEDKGVDELSAKFAESRAFIDHLLSSDKSKINAFLTKYNHVELNGESEVEAPSTIVLMDATGSMSSMIDLTKNAVKIMFQNMNKIAVEKSFFHEISVQFMVYRNYNAPPKHLLEESAWEVLSDNPSRLYSFMDSVRPNYGAGPEAIEVGFARVVEQITKEKKIIGQIILIGDREANDRHEVLHNRKTSGHDWLSSGRFAEPVYYKDEIQKLKDLNVKVNCFYLNEQAKSCFEEISNCTGGICQELKIGAPDASKKLTDVVSISTLKAAGGDELASAYRKAFDVPIGYLA